jgi:hypothetical protein
MADPNNYDATWATHGLNGPYGIAIDSTNTFLHVSNIGANTITRILMADPNIYDATWATQGIVVPSGIAIDSTNTFLYVANFSNSTISQVNLPVTCFKQDTKILTDKGYIPIQDLRKGDLVKTLNHDYKAIYMIGKREIYHPALQERIKEQLYKCSQEKYPEVFEDLIITGCHSILINNFISKEQKQKTIEVNGKIYITDNKYRLPACVDTRASVYETPGTYTIYHLALESDNYYWNYGIYANGLLVETCSKRYLTELSNMSLV